MKQLKNIILEKLVYHQQVDEKLIINKDTKEKILDLNSLKKITYEDFARKYNQLDIDKDNFTKKSYILKVPRNIDREVYDTISHYAFVKDKEPKQELYRELNEFLKTKLGDKYIVDITNGYMHELKIRLINKETNKQEIIIIFSNVYSPELELYINDINKINDKEILSQGYSVIDYLLTKYIIKLRNENN